MKIPKQEGMINRLMTTNKEKKQKLRNNEYYDIQEILDDLYNKSKNKNNYRFKKLMDIITRQQNIMLAYRNIKNNTGSTTAGTNEHTIEDLSSKSSDEIISYIRARFENYTPHEVRRVEIPKPDGKLRPLGIPTIEDRIIQQCILQVLEPICEGKFYNHSYGFRPNRSTHHAIARCYSLANINKLHYVVDVDIKGFFDNVNHGKLLKQMWSLGIQDKQLLCIISKLLKAPIEGIGKPTKGTPQGGILSPLLSNIVLNELDWWIAKQWEHFETKHNYTTIDKRNGREITTNKYASLRKFSRLKEVYIVRYADDFKVFCRDYKTAKKMLIAIKMWLKERLNLEISQEKSKIVNLNTNYSDFLGIKMKVHSKGSKKVIQSCLSNKAKNRIKKDLKKQIKKMQRKPDAETVNNYNSKIIGLHNYYNVTTFTSIDFAEISYIVNKTLYNRTKGVRSKKGIKSKCYEKYYGSYNSKVIYVSGIALFPIHGVKTKPPMNFSQDICMYTKEGRSKIHKNQQSVSINTLRYIMENPVITQSIEYNDNRISLYTGQKGICPISKEPLNIGNMECHHKIPKSKGGTDEYKNLIFLKTEIHKLVHATSSEIINKYLDLLNPDKNTITKLNKLRKLVGNLEIAVE